MSEEGERLLTPSLFFGTTSMFRIGFPGKERKMDFQKLVERAGFGLAFMIRYADGRMPEAFMEDMDFNQWLAVCDHAPAGSDLKALALRKLGEIAKTFEGLLYVYREAPARSDLKALTLQKLGEVAYTFDQWLRAYHEAPAKSDFEAMAFQKLEKLTNNLDRWLRAYHEAPAKSRLKAMALQKLIEVGRMRSWPPHLSAPSS
jgi:hypothetical protein